MNEEKRRVLDLLAQGKITAEQAEKLLDAISGNGKTEANSTSPKAAPKYLRVLVAGDNEESGGKVNIRIPLSLVRAGVRLAALLPQNAQDHVNKAMHDNGMQFDLTQLKPENVEEFIQSLNDFSVDVESNKGEKVRVFCE